MFAAHLTDVLPQCDSVYLQQASGAAQVLQGIWSGVLSVRMAVSSTFCHTDGPVIMLSLLLSLLLHEGHNKSCTFCKISSHGHRSPDPR